MMNRGDGIYFDGSAPMVNGFWYNPNTGDSFGVVDSYFEDNQYIVKTDDGRFIRYEQFMDYVQTETKMPKGKPEAHKTQNELPSEITNLIENPGTSSNPANDNLYGMLDDEMDLIYQSKPLGNLNNVQSTGFSQVVNETSMASNVTIINKALSKREMPEMQVSIDWKDFPKQEIKMLMDLMDVTLDEIIDWYIQSIDVNHYMNCLRDIIRMHINNQFDVPKPIEEPVLLEVEPEIPIEIPEVPVEKPKVTKTTKATKATSKPKATKEKKTKSKTH